MLPQDKERENLLENGKWSFTIQGNSIIRLIFLVGSIIMVSLDLLTDIGMNFYLIYDDFSAPALKGNELF